MRKRTLFVLLLCFVLVAAFSLAACGGGGGNEPAPAPAAPAETGGGDSGDAGGVEGKVVGNIPITLSNGFHQAETIWRQKFAEE